MSSRSSIKKFSGSSRSSVRPKAYIYTDAITGLIKIQTPFHRAFVEELKDRVPGNARRWKADEKVWEMDPTFLVELRRIANLFFEITEHEKVSALEGQMDDPYSVMLKLASDKALRDIYFILLDDVARGGSGDGDNQEALSVLGEAFKQISEEREI